MPVLRSIAAWLAIAALAVLNGMFREAVLLPGLGRPAALALSGLLLSSIILLVAIASARWLGLGPAARCLKVGTLWLALTLLFELGLGAALRGLSWAQLREAYSFRDGNLWPLVLAVTFIAPLAAARLRAAFVRG